MLLSMAQHFQPYFISRSSSLCLCFAYANWEARHERDCWLPCIIPSPFTDYADLISKKISEQCLRDLMCHKSFPMESMGKTDQNSLSSLYTILQPNWLDRDKSVQTWSFLSSSAGWSRRILLNTDEACSCRAVIIYGWRNKWQIAGKETLQM